VFVGFTPLRHTSQNDRDGFCDNFLITASAIGSRDYTNKMMDTILKSLRLNEDFIKFRLNGGVVQKKYRYTVTNINKHHKVYSGYFIMLKPTYLCIFSYCFLVFYLSGCTPTKKLNVIDIKPNIGEEKSIGIGDLFFENSKTSGTVFDASPGPCLTGETVGANSRTYLTLVGLRKETITLQYSEYFKQLCSPYAYNRYGLRPVKEAYNKRLDYSIELKTIIFKEYEFAILSVEGGKLTYKRLK
jgi:hypothetical protein